MNTIHIVQVPTGLSVPQPMLVAQNRLLGRFSGEPKADNLQNAVNNSNTALILAIDAESSPESEQDWQALPTDAYVGTLTLVFLQTPWHTTAHIEEVIVDGGQEGKGIGAKLVQKALEVGRTANVAMFDLTSGSSKVAAQALYQKMGFKKRETNNWRFED